MTLPPAVATYVSPAEMEFLVARAGLALNPGQMADLVLAWRQVAALIAAIPRERPMADDSPNPFRLPTPPPTASATKVGARAKPAAKRAVAVPKARAPVGRPKAKPQPPARKASSPKPAFRKPATRPTRPGKPPARKPAARKPPARKPPARTPAARKPAAGKPVRRRR